jgi:hypothetical protein
MPDFEQLVSRIGKQSYLAASLFSYLIANAFFPDRALITYTFMAMLIISGPLAIGRTARERWVTLVLAVAMIVAGYLHSLAPAAHLGLIASLIAAAFFLHLIYLISKSLLKQQAEVTAETLWAAINVYVLFGLLFAFLYTAVIAVEPTAFSGGILDNERNPIVQSMIYYSFVTMTTLGYGDITPKIQVAATLAYVQALVGQLYVAILIARLVSLYNLSDKE